MSETIQEFNGERYYLCGNYFQRRGRRLHIAVWKHYNGECIPHGFHVHHVDGNRANNNIENLELVLGKMHISRHARSEQREDYNKRHIDDMRKLAAEWHGSEEGLLWHSKQGKENWAKRSLQEYRCDFCGKSFETMYIYGEKQNTFCSNRCKSAFRRVAGLDNEVRLCAYCGHEFVVNKYSKTKYCSRTCSSNARWNK